MKSWKKRNSAGMRHGAMKVNQNQRSKKEKIKRKKRGVGNGNNASKKGGGNIFPAGLDKKATDAKGAAHPQR